MNWHDYFIYDKETGILTWKKRPREHFLRNQDWLTWNIRFSEKVAGHTAFARKNYKRALVCIDNKQYKAHRVVWELNHGPIPKGMEIDHEDGNPLNNKLSNLRLSTHRQNIQNQGLSASNTSGVTGVSWFVSRSKWIAEIGLNGKRLRIGYYDNFDDAVRARREAEKKHFGIFSRNAKATPATVA